MAKRQALTLSGVLPSKDWDRAYKCRLERRRPESFQQHRVHLRSNHSAAYSPPVHYLNTQEVK